MTINFDDIASLAWTQLWQVSLVAIVAGAVTRIACRDRPRLAYALWMLVVVKALTPPVWSSPTGVFSWFLAVREVSPSVAVEIRPVPILVSTVPTVSLEAENSPSIPSDDRISSQVALLAVWGVGLVAFLLLAIAKQAACSIMIRRSSLPVRDHLIATLDDLRRRLRIRRTVRLVVSPRPIGPAVFGLLRPTIVLPEILLAGKTSEQVELILAHELVHIKRGDIIAGYLQLAAQVVWWFHPLIWWATREATRERERCCDRDVVEGVGCRPSAYARTLLSVVELKSRLRIPAAIPGVRAMEVTSRRLEAIMSHGESRSGKLKWLPRLAFAYGAILLVPGAGLTLSAGADEKPKSETAKTQEDPRRAKELKTAEDRLRWSEALHERRYRTKAQVEADRWGVLELKLSPKEFSALRREMDLARADITRFGDRVDWADKMFEKGYVSEAQLKREELALRQARSQVETMEAKVKTLSQLPKDDATRATIVVIPDDTGKVFVYNRFAGAPKDQKGVTLKGVAREKGTGRPIAGASVSLDENHETVTDKDGRFEMDKVPDAPEYTLVGGPKSGDPFFITSARIKAAKGATTITADLEFVRGIPFRVRVVDKATGEPLLDKETGKPIQGGIGYFPVAPNNPYQRGVFGYSQIAADGMVGGAFYEASDSGRGEYLGAVLPGPGVLCFQTVYRRKSPDPTDHKPLFIFPDGEKAIKLFANDASKLYMVDLPIRGRSDYLGIVLNRYTAVIAINPKEDAKEVGYEIKLDQAEASK